MNDLLDSEVICNPREVGGQSCNRRMAKVYAIAARQASPEPASPPTDRLVKKFSLDNLV